MAWEQLMVPQLIGILAGFVAVVATPKHAPRDFFAASAQIVVVLMLAVALQSRLLWVRFLEVGPMPAPGHSGPVGDNRGGTFFARVMWAAIAAVPLLYAQFASLAVLLQAGNRGGDPQAIMGAIAWTVMALLTTAVLADPNGHPPNPEPANGGDHDTPP